MATSSKVKIAIIGTGHIGPRHAKSVAASEGAELHCFIDPAPQAQPIAKSFNVPFFSSIPQMIEEGVKPDAAIVCTPNSTHVAVSKRLLAAGIDVLVEKPISTTIASGEELLRAAKDSGRRLLVGHHRRFNPYVTAAKAALAEGVIGRPIALSGLWVACKPSSYFDAPVEWRGKAGNGGPILINLIHEVDTLQYLLGPIVRVHAEQTTSHRTHEVEEGAAILLRFTSGVVGTFVLSDAAPSYHFFESATGENPMIPQAGRDIYRMFGSEGTLSVGDGKVVRSLGNGKKAWTGELREESVSAGDEVPFDEQVKHFVRVIRGEEEARCTGEDGLSALIVCDAIRRAMMDGTAVDIPRTAT